jgi:predicted amino acid dehydrogenase
VACAQSLHQVREADVVVCAASSVGPLLGLEHLSPGAIVCDLSVPPAVACGPDPTTGGNHVITGGVARLPYGEEVDIPGFPLAGGQVYGCQAEGLALALEGVRDKHFTGPVTPAKVQRIEQIAIRHGFELASAAGIFHIRPDWEQAHVSAGC